MPFLDHQCGAIRHTQATANQAFLRLENNLALAGRHDLVIVRRLDRGHPVQAHHTLDLRSALCLSRDSCCGASDMERTKRQLRTRLTDGLGRQDTHGLPDIDHLVRRQISSITHPAKSPLRLTREDRPDLDDLDARGFDRLGRILPDELTGRDQKLPIDRIVDVFECNVTHDSVGKRLDDVFTLLEGHHLETEYGTAVVRGDGDVLRHVDQAPGEVPCVSGFESRVGETFSRPVRRDEVLDHTEALAEVRLDRALDDLTDAPGQLLLWLRHQAAHPRQLPHLVAIPSCSRRHHHVDGVEPFLRTLQALDHRIRHVVVRVGPCVDDLVVPLPIGDVPAGVRLLEPCDLLAGLLDDLRLFFGHLQVRDTHTDPAHGRVAEAEVLEVVEEFGRLGQPDRREGVEDEVVQFPLSEGLIQEPQFLGNDGVEEHAAGGSAQPLAGNLPVLARVLGNPVPTRASELQALGFHAHLHLSVRREAGHSLVELVQSFLSTGPVVLVRLEVVRHNLEIGDLQGGFGQVVASDHHVLRRSHDGPPVGGEQNVVAREHQHACLQLSLERKRHVDRHLVPIEVGVERRTHERMDAYRFPFHEDRLESLNSQPVEGGRPVQQNRVILDDVLEDLVNFRIVPFDDLLRPLDGLGLSPLLQLMDDERLEELHGHRLGKAALVQLELGTHHDDRAARVVDALPEQVLAEAPLLPFEHVGQRLEWTFAATTDGLRPPPVIEQRVHGLLEHSLLVPKDDLRCLHVDEFLEAVVPVDDPSVKIIQVGSSEPASVEGHERPQVGRNYRDHVHDHPLGTIRLVLRAA